MSAAAVRTQDINVRSVLKRVRNQEKWLSAVGFTANLLGSGAGSFSVTTGGSCDAGSFSPLGKI
jgi:hypothetical protein